MSKLLTRQEFDYIIDTLTGYTDETKYTEVITKSLLSPQTVQNITVKVGLKPDTVTTLKVLDSDPIFQAGGCGWSPTGSTTIADFDLKTCSERLNETYCPKDLYNTYLTTMLQPGQTETTLPYTDVMLSFKAEQIARHIEESVWKNSIDGGDCFDGFLELLVSGTTGVGVSVSGTAFNALAAYGSNGNPLTECEKLVDALDDDAMSRNDLAIFMSFSNYRKYIQSLVKANFFINYINGGKIEGDTISTLPNL